MSAIFHCNHTTQGLLKHCKALKRCLFHVRPKTRSAVWTSVLERIARQLTVRGFPQNWPLAASQVSGGTSDQDVEKHYPKSAGQPNINLRLIATSDLHACLMPYDYCSNRPAPERGLGEVSRQIALARAEAPNSLLFDNGDFLQGSPLADFVANSRRRRRPHPVIAAFNALEYDAATLGNHEFDYGLEFLSKAISHAHFPIVSSNITTELGSDPARDRTLVPPYAILRRQVIDAEGRDHLLRIGVIGFAPPQIEMWENDRLKGRIRMRDIIASARAWLPRLRADGADVIVALAHSGIGSPNATDRMENAAAALAALPEIDAVIAGHSHLTFPGPDVAALAGIDPIQGLLAGKPAVMPGHSGRQIGIIDLQLTRIRQGKRRWQISSGHARLGTQDPATSALAPGLRRAIAPDHRATLVWSRQQLGETRVPLMTHFATIAPTAALALIAEAKAAHARKILSGTEWAGLPILGAASPFRAGGLGGSENYTDIPAGPFRMCNLLDLYPFPNSLVALAMTAVEITEWLERSVSAFHQIAPGTADRPLHDPAFPSFGFDCIPGLDYAVDLSQPARYDMRGAQVRPDAHRIVGLGLGGRLLTPGARLLLVTNSHRASRIGGGQSVVLAKGVRVQTVIADHVREMVTVGAPPRRNWHFLPMPGSTVRFATGPASKGHLAEIAHLRPQLIEHDAKGFAHFRLHL